MTITPGLKTLYEAEPQNPRPIDWATPDVLNSEPFKKFESLIPGFTLNNCNLPSVKRRNLDLLKRVSHLAREVSSNRQGWLFPEKIYLGDPAYLSMDQSDASVDRFIMRQPMCHSLRTRYYFVADVLMPGFIREALSRNGRVRIASFGSGTGRDVLEAMSNFRGEDVTADFFDIDSTCLDVGSSIAKSKGLAQQVRFIRSCLTNLPPALYDIGVFVGVICSVSDRHSSIAARKVKRLICPNNGKLIASSSSEKMKTDDLLSRFLIEYTADWFLNFRDEKTMRGLFANMGFADIQMTAEPTGFHRFAICSMKRS